MMYINDLKRMPQQQRRIGQLVENIILNDVEASLFRIEWLANYVDSTALPSSDAVGDDVYKLSRMYATPIQHTSLAAV